MRRQKKKENEINIKGSCKYFVSKSRRKLVRFVAEIYIKDGDGCFKAFLPHCLTSFLVEVHKLCIHMNGENQYVVLTSYHYNNIYNFSMLYKELLGGFPLFRKKKEFYEYGNKVHIKSNGWIIN